MYSVLFCYSSILFYYSFILLFYSILFYYYPIIFYSIFYWLDILNILFYIYSKNFVCEDFCLLSSLFSLLSKGVRTIAPEENRPSDNCHPGNWPLGDCPPDHCTPRKIAPGENCSPDNCPQG